MTTKRIGAGAVGVSALVLAVAGVAQGAITYGTAGSVYTEDFNLYGGDIGAVNWDNDSTIPGWWLFSSRTNNAATVNPTTGEPENVQRTNVGGGATGFYLWRSGPTATDVTLGSLNTDTLTPGVGTGYLSYGVGLVNNTSRPITRFSLKYAAERWVHNSTNTTDSTSVSYLVAPTNGGVGDGAGAWADTGMGYTAGSTAATTTITELILNPTDPFGTVTGINWQPGQSLFVRWKDVNISTIDRGTGIDDVRFVGWTDALALEPVGSGVADINMTGASGSFAIEEYAVPAGEAVAGSTVIRFGIAPGDSRTIIVALDLQGEAPNIAAAVAAAGASTAVEPFFGAGYDAQVTLTGFGNQYYTLTHNFAEFGVTLANIAVVPEPAGTSVVMLGAVGVLGRRRRV